MGLHEKNNTQSNFLAVKHGALCLESNEPRDGYDQVTVHNPTTDSDVIKYVKRYAALDGMVTKLEWYDRDSNGVRYVGLKIHIKDNGEYFQLDLPANKRHYDYLPRGNTMRKCPICNRYQCRCAAKQVSKNKQ
jgi:hypothetical protein